MPPLDPSQLAALLARVVATVNHDGWAIQPAAGPAGAFAYTVGLTRHRHPELLVRDLPVELAGGLLDRLARQVAGGARFTAGDAATVDYAPGTVGVRLAHADAGELFVAARLYGPARVTALRVTVDA